MIKGIKHLGIVVKDLEDMLAFLQQVFGAEEVERTEYPDLKQVSSTVRVGNGFLEIMQPTAPDGAVGKFLESKGGGLHHISLLCDDVQNTSKHLEAQGLQIIGKMFEGPVKVAFIHPKNSKGILFELSEGS